MKKVTKYIAFATTITILAQLGIVNAANINSVTPDQVVQESKSHDLGTQIDDMETNLKRLRAVYTPTGAGLGAGPWANTYTYSIAPLLTGAKQKADDYQTDNDHLNNEYKYYDNAYTYWLLCQNYQFKLENLSLAQHEMDITNEKLKQGIASQNDLLQAQISVNNAQSDSDKADMAKQVQMYQINQAMDSDIEAPLSVDSVNLDFLSADDLNVEHTLSYIYQTHKSLDPLNELYSAYMKAKSIAAGETDDNVPTQDLVDYYSKELEETQLKLKQQRQRLEIATRSYIEQAKTLEETIKLDQDNVDKVKNVYDNNTKLYEVGMSTFNDLETVRLKLLAANLQLASDQKDYITLKEKLRLFKSGAIFTS